VLKILRSGVTAKLTGWKLGVRWGAREKTTSYGLLMIEGGEDKKGAYLKKKADAHGRDVQTARFFNYGPVQWQSYVKV